MTVLSARALAGGYGGRDVVRGVDAELAAGECLAILGPNGAGKSTLLRLLAGVLPARGGAVELLSRDLARWRRRDVARVVGFVPQFVDYTFPLTVREIVEQGRAPHLGPWRPAGPADRDAVARALARVRLSDRADTPIQRLSGGERQRVLLARALASEPRVLLLDEPATALDVAHQLDLVSTLEALRGTGAAVALVVHDWNLAVRAADRFLVLRDGRVATAGSRAAVIRPEVFRDVFGVAVEIFAGSDGHPVIVPTGVSG